VRVTFRIIAIFAALGFLMPGLALAFYAIAGRMNLHPSYMWALYLCPPALMALGLEGASPLAAAFEWLLIGLCNAVLYAIPGLAVGLYVYLRNSN
jgi:hypothetical protein